ncbi:MAG: glycosyltransferase family 4 protein [Chromatiales bacterium]|nr:glycosyltransferase family 4 protein [Chromatiales bacterium]
MTNRLRTLTFSTLFPNAERPEHGIFVATRLAHLLASGAVDTRIVAPVPWFPFRGRRFGEWSRHARVPAQETWQGVPVVHPRYALPPKIGMTVAPALLAAATLPAIRRIIRNGFDFELIDAHYYYPDGVAAAWLGRRLGKPVVITARGTDLNLIPRHRIARAQIRWAERNAAASITVCEALRDRLIELGGRAQHIHTLSNGVDLQRFRPLDRDALRTALGFTGTTLLSVGHLIERKGVHLTIDALAQLPDVRLVLVGDGPERERLVAQAARMGVADRVRFEGAQPQSRLVDYYNAADALVLASSREGMANVLLESMACGTPVLASRVWGTPEVVADPAAGRMLDERSARGIVNAVYALLAAPPSRAGTRAWAERFDWDTTTTGQIDLFSAIRAQRTWQRTSA